MKALVFEDIETLALRDWPDPTPAEGEHLIRIEAVGICGSDMHAYLGHDARRPAPLILGHEAAGTIQGGARDGERVTINPLVTCGACHACASGRENICPNRQIISMPPREGAFAQFVTMPAQNLVTVPDHVPLSQAALAEPLAVSWHAVRLALARLGDWPAPRALVLGGGAIGLAAALALKAMGVKDVTVAEPNDARRAYLSEVCALPCVAAPQGSFPVVIDAVGFGTTRATASSLVAPGGVIAHVGLGQDEGGLDIRRMTLQEITFLGCYTYTAQDFRDTAQAIFDGRLGPLDWAETRPLGQGAAAFADLRGGRVAAPKLILDPWA
ncbi:alcohol dehydrogenase catalytic domain-containing protein [Roseovarius aestuariivivens]|uniref:alcohol dehydrogenase catalytic domain-containing protein n=1 Tax=Roseovarius aestuariivivens TaxID=1888910 RepID=UPI0010806819|nr:alcohol dehydrogenase catalytic domain-containing protein [Roseovarius aestuariivivens]